MIIAVNAEVTGSNPVEALIFFRLLLSNCLNWKISCDDHSSFFTFTFIFVFVVVVFFFFLFFFRIFKLLPQSAR